MGAEFKYLDCGCAVHKENRKYHLLTQKATWEWFTCQAKKIKYRSFHGTERNLGRLRTEWEVWSTADRKPQHQIMWTKSFLGKTSPRHWTTLETPNKSCLQWHNEILHSHPRAAPHYVFPLKCHFSLQFSVHFPVFSRWAFLFGATDPNSVLNSLKKSVIGSCLGFCTSLFLGLHWLGLGTK